MRSETNGRTTWRCHERNSDLVEMMEKDEEKESYILGKVAHFGSTLKEVKVHIFLLVEEVVKNSDPV